MRGTFDGVARVRATLYFRDIQAWIVALYEALRTISSAFAALVREYDSAIPRCRLRLYLQPRPPYGQLSLEWGTFIPLGSRLTRRVGSPKRTGLRRLPGPFQDDWAYLIAMRKDFLSQFNDFDRRAKVLNRARAAIFKALRVLKLSTLAKFKVKDEPSLIASGLCPDIRIEVPEIPANARHEGLPAEFRRYLKAGWIAAFSLGLAEEEFCELAREVSQNPSADGISLEISARSGRSWVRRVFWFHGQTGARFPKLTHRAMKRARVAEGVRPVLSQKEFKRARISRRFLEVGRALDLLRKRCVAAQLALSTGLAEAKVFGQVPAEVRAAG